MNFVLDEYEVRVLGALLEKSLATPDNYPLTLASVTTACNQKSNRDPVLEMSESDVRTTLDSLIQKHLVRERNAAGARVPKFGHRLADALGLSFNFSSRELGVLCVLMLRGPQTPGELRSRTNRLCEFDSAQQVEDTLQSLAAAERGPYTLELPRSPGQRECRHLQLWGGSPDAEKLAALSAQATTSQVGTAAGRAEVSELKASELNDRVVQLEEQVELLELELAELRDLVLARGSGDT